jgi:hypothetical protein
MLERRTTMNTSGHSFQTTVVKGDKTMDQIDNTRMTVHHHRQPGARIKVGAFLWHLIQMIVAMEAGMAVYHLLLGTLLAQTGYAALTKAYPLFGYWMMVVSMTLPMIGLMRFQRSSWRHCLEMSVAMVAPSAMLTLLALVGSISFGLLSGAGDPAMYLAMTAYMLYRRDDHGAHGHSSHPHTRAHTATTASSNQ